MSSRSWLGKVAQVGEDGDDVVLGICFNEGGNLRELRLPGAHLDTKPQQGQTFEMLSGAEPDPAMAEVIRIDGTEVRANIAVAC